MNSSMIENILLPSHATILTLSARGTCADGAVVLC